MIPGERLVDMIKNENKPSREFHQKLKNWKEIQSRLNINDWTHSDQSPMSGFEALRGETLIQIAASKKASCHHLKLLLDLGFVVFNITSNGVPCFLVIFQPLL